MSEMASWTNLDFSVDVANVLVTSGERPTLQYPANALKENLRNLNPILTVKTSKQAIIFPSTLHCSP